MPALDRLYTRWHATDIRMLAVAIDTEHDGRVHEFAQKLGLHMPLMSLDQAPATPRYWTWGVPVTYLIDPAGTLKARALGERDWDSAAVDALLRSLSER